MLSVRKKIKPIEKHMISTHCGIDHQHAETVTVVKAEKKGVKSTK